MAKSDKVFSVNKAEDSVGFLLWQATTVWERGVKKTLEPFDLTHSQFVLLASLLWLSSQQENVTQIDLSVHSKIDPMTTSSVVRTLEKKKFVQRKEHSSDTRAKAITLTSNGLALARRAIKVIEKFDKEFFGALNLKLNDFKNALQTLIKEA
ncbi:MAG: MarR family transcriptional regulator [Filimonas sp.]|nr:MarR family transcriptional regulator [Filimonas sp.]